MVRLLLTLPVLVFCLGGCIPQPILPASGTAASAASDQLLWSGIQELGENRQPAALEKLVVKFPNSRQAELAADLLAWRRQRLQSPPEGRKSSDTELRELREENRRLRSDLEQLKKLLIESERRAP